MEYGNNTLVEFSKTVNRDITTISRQVNEFRNRLREDNVLKERVNELIEELSDN